MTEYVPLSKRTPSERCEATKGTLWIKFPRGIKKGQIRRCDEFSLLV